MPDAMHRAAPGALLRLNGVSKSLGGNLVLDRIALEVPDGQVLAVMGPSGGGKSTMLRCINLLERPDRGEVVLDGTDLTAARPAELARLRARIGMVFQLFNLFPHLTARDNVALAAPPDARSAGGGGRGAGAGRAGARRPRPQGGCLSTPSLRRAAATRRHRARHGDAPAADAVRRADLRPRCRDGCRGAAGDARPWWRRG